MPAIRLLVLGLAAAFLTACEKPTEEPAGAGAGGGAEKGALVVGFAQVGAESAWRTAETRSIREEAEKRGVELKFADAQQKQENQIRAVRSFVQQRVDAIILAPVVETGWEPVLMEAKRAGVPVVLVDRGVDVADDSLYVTLVASDFIEEGRMAGEWLADALDGRGRVVELQGTPGAAPAIDRKKGFEEVLAGYPDLTIVRSQSGNFTRSTGKEVMEAFLKAESEPIDAVYAHNDDMALGAIQAIREAGLEPGTDIVIVSIDGGRAVFEAMVAGDMNCTVECDPLLGPLAFDAVERALAGETLEKWIKVNDRLFDQSTAEAELPNRKY